MKDILNVIRELRRCASEMGCIGCTYVESGNCYDDLKKDAADLLELYVSEEDDLKRQGMNIRKKHIEQRTRNFPGKII